ncbi:MAG: hypothetical protein ACK5YR_13905, partial [Pirellula sp.]
MSSKFLIILLLLATSASAVSPFRQPPGGNDPGMGGPGGGGAGGGNGNSAISGSAIQSSGTSYGAGAAPGDGSRRDCAPQRADGQANDECCPDDGDESLGGTGGGGGEPPSPGGGPGCGNACSPGKPGGEFEVGSRLFGHFSASDITRIWIPNNRANYSSLSPGHYTQFDSQIYLFPETGGNSIHFFDVFDHRVFEFVDGLEGDTLDGTYHDVRNKHAKKIELLNSSNSIVTSLSSAAWARVTHWNGATEKFQVVDLDTSSTGSLLAGRLTERKNRLGMGSEITYKTWTQTQLNESSDRQFQIDNISDDWGNTLTFTYGTSQQSGRWAVTQVSRQDSASVSFAYTSGALASATFPGGLQTTYTYGQDTNTQTATIRIQEARGVARDLTYHLTNDYVTIGQNVISQPVGIRRMVKTQDNIVEWMLVPHSNPAVDEQFIFTGGNAARILSGGYAYQEFDTWEVTSGPQALSNFNGIGGTLNSQVIGPGSGVTLAQKLSGEIPAWTDNTDRTKGYEYDSSGNRTKITYTEDNTFEAFSYNSFGQATRHRTRDGKVTLYTYDSQGNQLTKAVGLEEVSGSDQQTADYAVYSYEYYGSTHANAGLRKAEMSPLYNSSSPTLHRTDFEYDTSNRLTKIIGPATATGQPRPETVYAYNTAGMLTSATDPLSQTTTYTYDNSKRLVTTTYPDSTTEQVLYGTGANAGRVIKTKDRMGMVTTMTYDNSGLVTQQIVSAAIDANILDGNADDETITDPNRRRVTQYVYLQGSDSLKSSVTVNGAKTEYTYDYHNRVTEVKQHTSSGKSLISTKTYLDNQLLCDIDPYGRRKYYGYRASDGTLIRTVTATHPGYTLADFAAVWSLTRSTAANAAYIIHDAIRDDDGHLTQIIDARGTETRFEYDSLGRETKKTTAFGTALAAVTETYYDDANHVIEVRTPRYFDSSDTEGFQKARETWTYNGRGLVASHTEATGSTIAATESFTYDLRNRQLSRTDYGSNTWTQIYDSCCDKQSASVDPLGHGTITNTDSNRRTVHTATVSDVSTQTGSFLNPDNAKTLSESTTRYDSLGRVTYQTTWLTARGAISPALPPIAGLGGVPLSDGLTTQYLYDDNLADGVGLENAAGVSVPRLGTGGTGTFNVSLSNAITKLAQTTANGGAGISFSSVAPGRATIVINPEDEISFSIADAAGRTVMSGKLNNYRGSGSTALNTLATWSCTVFDATTSLSGFGTVLVTTSVDALGKTTSTWTDGAGRTLRSIDQLAKVTTMTYDPAGNQLSVRDPNNVGADMVYDALGRNTQRTDTASAVTKTEYDKAGNAVKQIDAKNKNTFITYDARGRRKTTTDRISAATVFTYTSLGQLASLTDDQAQTTSYTYNARGNKLTETYPDHTGGSPGASTYGIVTFVYDNAGRVLRKQDQLGDTVTHTYDLAGRMTTRAYRTRVNSPSGTIADSDTFTFDRASRMLTAVNGRYTNTVTMTYDPIGRKATEGLTISGRTYTTTSEYNARGELTKLTYPDSSIAERTYHDTGALHLLKLDGSTISTRTYDDGRRLTGETLGNGVTETRTYSTDNLLSGISYGGTGTSIGNLSYTWDANKNKTSETIGGTMSGYGFTSAGTSYDDEDRLTGFARTSGTFTQSWNLTKVGDWTSVTTNGTAQNRTHGPTHELLTAGGQNISTDVKGNITVLPAN